MIRLQGGLLTPASRLPDAGAVLNQTALVMALASGARLSLPGWNIRKTASPTKGRQIPLIMFDELVQFTADSFGICSSRCRSMSGIQGLRAAATNPDPDSWLRSSCHGGLTKPAACQSRNAAVSCAGSSGWAMN